MASENVDPLRLALHHVEEQLDDRVEAVGEAKPASEESTSELIKLEETLSSAQDKAKKLVTLRLKLREEEGAADGTDADADNRLPPDGVTSAGEPPAA